MVNRSNDPSYQLISSEFQNSGHRLTFATVVKGTRIFRVSCRDLTVSRGVESRPTYDVRPPIDNHLNTMHTWDPGEVTLRNTLHFARGCGLSITVDARISKYASHTRSLNIPGAHRDRSIRQDLPSIRRLCRYDGTRPIVTSWKRTTLSCLLPARACIFIDHPRNWKILSRTV